MNTEWLGELNRLTVDDLLEVKARVNALLSLQSTPPLSVATGVAVMPIGVEAVNGAEDACTTAINDNVDDNVDGVDRNDFPALSTLPIDAVLRTVADTMNRLGVAVDRNLSAFRRSTDFRSWQRNILPPLNDYFKNANIRQRNVKIALLALGVEMLIGQFQAWDVPASPRAICLGLLRIPALIDRHYPGYAASGLLALVVARPHDRRQYDIR